MNYENLALAVAAIEANPECYDQTVWHSPCGTMHCLAGFCQMLADGLNPAVDRSPVRTTIGACRAATEWLGLTEEEGDYLFGVDRVLADFKFAFGRKFSESGHDVEGFNREGFNREGYDEYGCDREGFNREGYDEYGRDREG